MRKRTDELFFSVRPEIDFFTEVFFQSKKSRIKKRATPYVELPSAWNYYSVPGTCWACHFVWVYAIRIKIQKNLENHLLKSKDTKNMSCHDLVGNGCCIKQYDRCTFYVSHRGRLATGFYLVTADTLWLTQTSSWDLHRKTWVENLTRICKNESYCSFVTKLLQPLCVLSNNIKPRSLQVGDIEEAKCTLVRWPPQLALARIVSCDLGKYCSRCSKLQGTGVDECG